MEQVDSFTYMNAFPVQHYRMDNGLAVLLVHNPISPVAAYLTHYTVGSALEGDRERGLAHFFEHMMFRETAKLKDGDFDRVMAEVGGVGLNAFTSYDTTAYHVNVPSEQLTRVIEVEADRMVNLRLSPELIEIERGAVLGEMNMYKDMPSDQLWNTLMAVAFPAHPYRHPIIGYTEQVSAFRDEDFARFYHTHYAPNRAVVVVAGGFDEPWLLGELERAYGGLKPGGARPPSAPPDAPWAESRHVEVRHDKISTDNLMLAWRTPGVLHADQPALAVLGAVLSAGQSSPLYRRLVADGLGTQVAAFSMEAEMYLASPALFLVDVALQHDVPAERAEAAVQAVLEALGRDGIPPAELERALNQTRLAVYSGLRSNMSLARQVGGHAVACDDPRFGEHLVHAMERVTGEEVMTVLERYLTGAPRLTVVQRPGDGGNA
ncbi:MAG TPA: pitrilysin family protein [bacterium]|nr:pitrilysin family protein [bacterium]